MLSLFMIGILGGSGFYSLLDEKETITMTTPYGDPSSDIHIGSIAGKRVAFMTRHGASHRFPPHMIPYKANIWAFKKLGVSRIISPAAVGSLKREIRPGDFLIPDQFINFTNRECTFYDGPETVHIALDQPYCPELAELLLYNARQNSLRVHENGTVVVVNGPGFSSHAESTFFRNNGWDVVNMTQYPELALARELEICYASICIVTDYDTGVKDDPMIKPVSIEEVLRVFRENNQRIKELLHAIIPKIPDSRSCICSRALQGARI